MSAVRSRISSKLIFASCVGYFDRVYYGFYVTSSRLLDLTEGDKIRQHHQRSPSRLKNHVCDPVATNASIS